MNKRFDLNKTTKEFCIKHGYVEHLMGYDEWGQELGWCCPLCHDINTEVFEEIEVVVTRIYRFVESYEKENKNEDSIHC